MLSLLAVSVAIMVSSRATDPRAAEQLAGVVVLPLILVVVGQAVGLFILDTRLIVPAAIIVLAVDVLLLYLSVRTFDRETILTRWK
jgi:ABC-2 type transport system permease protein